FIPVGEPVIPPTTPITIDEILDYAERNHSFHSDYGVCAGPRMMVRELLQVLIEGRAKTDYASVELDEPLENAFADLEAALDYALLGLRAYASVFSLWPAMTRAYERLAEIAARHPDRGNALVEAMTQRLHQHLDSVRNRTLLGSEEWRVDREQVYADMYDRCGDGIAGERSGPSLIECLAPVRSSNHAATEHQLEEVLARRLGNTGILPHALAVEIMDFLTREQAVLRTATDVQEKINLLLGRTAPSQPFSAAEIDVHNLLLGAESRRLPYLVDELEDLFGIQIVLDPSTLAVKEQFKA